MCVFLSRVCDKVKLPYDKLIIHIRPITTSLHSALTHKCVCVTACKYVGIVCVAFVGVVAKVSMCRFANLCVHHWMVPDP